jgi:hypothetical protein
MCWLGWHVKKLAEENRLMRQMQIENAIEMP